MINGKGVSTYAGGIKSEIFVPSISSSECSASTAVAQEVGWRSRESLAVPAEMALKNAGKKVIFIAATR